jgi:hypothetical protein
MSASDTPEIRNARIKDATITKADHGLLTVWLHLDYGGTGQGFGGYVLHLNPGSRHYRLDHGYAGHFIWRVLEIAGVDEWSELVDKTIRVKTTMSKCHAIGHILKDDWFDPAADMMPKEETA